MEITTVQPSYPDSLIMTMGEQGYSHVQLVSLMFGIIDRFCEQLSTPLAGPDSARPMREYGLETGMLMHLA